MFSLSLSSLQSSLYQQQKYTVRRRVQKSGLLSLLLVYSLFKRKYCKEIFLRENGRMSCDDDDLFFLLSGMRRHFARGKSVDKTLGVYGCRQSKGVTKKERQRCDTNIQHHDHRIVRNRPLIPTMRRQT
jgi:hypothetical protein